MSINTVYMSLVCYGVVGGFAINILNFIELLRIDKSKRPDLGDWVFWLVFASYPILGGFMVHMHLADGCMFTRILAFQVGLSGPLILRAMAAFGK